MTASREWPEQDGWYWVQSNKHPNERPFIVIMVEGQIFWDGDGWIKERWMREQDATFNGPIPEPGSQPEPDQVKDALLSLLADIHQDGGNYTQEHGLKKSIKDAAEAVRDLQRFIDTYGE